MSRQALRRALALAQLRETATDDQALGDVEAYLVRALELVREERTGPEHISTVLSRALGAIPQPKE